MTDDFGDTKSLLGEMDPYYDIRDIKLEQHAHL